MKRNECTPAASQERAPAVYQEWLSTPRQPFVILQVVQHCRWCDFTGGEQVPPMLLRRKASI